MYAAAERLETLPGDSLLRLMLAAAGPSTGLPVAAAAGQRLRLMTAAGPLDLALARPAPAGARALLLRRPPGRPAPAGPLFVFGLEHDDVRTVDYEALAMLNVSATQALAAQLAQARAEAAGAAARAARAEAAAAQATAATADVLRRVQALEAQGQQARR